MATTQRRGRTAPTTKRAVPKKKPVPFELTSTTEPTHFDEREPLFSVNGVVHDVLVEVPANVALEYLITIAEEGEGAGIVFALNYALGPVSRRALMTHRGLGQDQLQAIIAVIRAKFDGALKAPKAMPSSD